MLQALVQADCTLCSTSPLADALVAIAHHREVLPNCLDDELWGSALQRPLMPFSDDDRIRLAYVGSHSHEPDLEWIAPLLRELLDSYPNLWIRIWGLRPPDVLHGHERVSWDPHLFVDYARYVEYFLEQRVDIFIAPLLDNLFNRCKSGLKYLEYSALGVPGVYSALPPYASLVRHGINGFLAPEDLAEWRQLLSQLIEQPLLRREIGRQAWTHVTQQGVLSAHRDVYERVYRSLLLPHVLRTVDTDLLEILEQDEDNRMQEQLRRELFRVQKALVRAEQESRASMRELEVLREEVRELRQTLQEMRDLLSQAEQEANSLRQQLAVVENSLGWRLIQAMTPLRYRLVPAGSAREAWLWRLVHAVQRLSKEGFVQAVRSLREPLPRSQELPHITDLRGHSFPVLVDSGEPHDPPAIAVLLIDDLVPKAKLNEWLASQTLPRIPIVEWQGGQIVVHAPGQEPQVLPATGLAEALEALSIHYLAPGTPWLLEQPPTYLEEQLTVLLSERLLFTVTLTHENGEASVALARGAIPAHTQFPWAHIVAHREAIKEEGHLDLGFCCQTPARADRVVGKILFRPEGPGTEEHYVGTLEIAGASVHLEGQYLYVLSSTRQDMDTWPVHPLYLVDTVLPWATESADKPTIFMVFPFLALGGAERVHLYMLRELQHDARFVVISLEPHMGGIGTTIENFRQYTPYVYTAGDFLSHPLLFSWFTGLIDRFQPQMLYIANGCHWIYDALPHIRERYPDLKVANQVYDHRAGWINRYTPELVRLIDVHIGTNTAICQEYVRRGAPPDNVYLIEHCVDIEEYTPERFPTERRNTIRAKLNIPEGHRVVTFMARLHPQKRPMDFVELARRFAHRDDVLFLLVGDGPLAHAVEREIHRIGLTNIRRIPFYRPSSEIFAITDVYVLPSEYEGMPLVLLEAQAMGIPVVVTDVGNNREVLQVTQGGVLVETIGDIAALQHGVEQLLHKPPDAVELRRALIEDLSQQFGILPAQMGEKYRQALHLR